MQTITVNSGNKDDAYIATVLLFNSIQQLCNSGLGDWVIKEAYTNVSDGVYITAYTNGKMFIKAYSAGFHHTYTFGKEIKPCKQQ